MREALNWADVLDRELDYAVLAKGNRLQVIVRPSRKQLQRRGKRGWSAVAALDAPDGQGRGGLPAALEESVLEALKTLTSGVSPSTKKSGKKKQATKS